MSESHIPQGSGPLLPSGPAAGSPQPAAPPASSALAAGPASSAPNDTPGETPPVAPDMITGGASTTETAGSRKIPGLGGVVGSQAHGGAASSRGGSGHDAENNRWSRKLAGVGGSDAVGSDAVGSGTGSSGGYARPASVGGTDGPAFPGGPGAGPGFSGGSGGPGGGGWVWMMPEPRKRSWRSRHPILFWLSVILILAGVFAWGRTSGESKRPGEPYIAVVNIEGLILDADATVEWMETVRKDKSAKGALIRINSPGGAVGPSQELYEGVKRLAEAKPVVVSMGALAASGGYYAALGAKDIYATPSTLTASIGVKMQIPNIEGLSRIIGVSEKTLASGALKDAGNSWRPMTAGEEAYLRGLIGDMYEEFIKTVAERRDLPLDEVRKAADGRAMTGRQALEAKLIDKLGDRHAAMSDLKRRCGLTGDVPVVEGPEKEGSFLRELLRSSLNILQEERARVEMPLFLY